MFGYSGTDSQQECQIFAPVARFLSTVLPDQWYYNAGCKPTEEVIYKRPELVHRVKLLFGVHMLGPQLYNMKWKEWRQQYTVHLLTRHRYYLDVENLEKWPFFDEINIKD